MSKTGGLDVGWRSGADWRSARDYRGLLKADRRAFAWEWLRRHRPYRLAWRNRHVPPETFGLLAYEDPDRATPDARPLWTTDTDPQVLGSRPASGPHGEGDLFDIRCVAEAVAVAVDEHDNEHWLLTDGHWVVRLDLHEGTLLGGPLYLQHDIKGFDGTAPKLATLRRLGAIAHHGNLPASLRPREARAPRWVLELRTADALAVGASQQEMARLFFGRAISDTRWRLESGSYRMRVRRLVRLAHHYLENPFGGPWFA